MLRRLAAALRVALRDEDFGRVLSAGLALIVIGTVAYSLGAGWSVDPGLTITDPWLKVFTAGYVLVGGRGRSPPRHGAASPLQPAVSPPA